MTDQHKNIIRSNFDTLADNLIIDCILNMLLAKSIITEREQKELSSGANNPERLLCLLLTREDRGFYVLIDACKKYNMPHLANLLIEGGKKVQLFL